MLGGDASLAQSGLVAAKENAVFIIGNGTAAAGLRAANNYFSGGCWQRSARQHHCRPLARPSCSTPRNSRGWTLAPIIELDGTNAFHGLRFQDRRGGSTVRGFVVNNFQNWYGVELTGAGETSSPGIIST